jgi:hypothetical protein
MRDPSRAPVDVLVRDLSMTGALLEAEADLPVGTLVSLGIAGAGMQFSRVVRNVPQGLAIEFMLPLDASVVAVAGRVETLRSVAIPQMPVPPSAVALAGEADRALAAETAAGRTLSSIPVTPAALIALLLAATLLYLVL